ncbi:MarR family transcriptional regulator [bacterium 1XD42-8]|nr:MarR family transcriptional regulator [Lachnospiraceae bacterium]RKJ39455.1 MarR family transcriptional regulator [bacterium 1XD42-8]
MEKPLVFIGYEIKTVSNLLKRKLHNPPLFPEGSITEMHGMIIEYLYQNQETKDLFQKDIEAKFSIRRSTATGILQLMEKNKIIIRESVPYDARLKKIVLTKEAIAKYQLVKEKIYQLEEQIQQGLTDEEIQVFYKIMNQIKKNLKEKKGDIL